MNTWLCMPPENSLGWEKWDMLTGAAPVMKVAPQGALCALGFWHALVLMLVASETVARFR